MCVYVLVSLSLILATMVKIISLNVRGLQYPVKRRSIFTYYRQRADILCLQETHCDAELENIFKAEWGGKAYFAHSVKNARGVCILLGNQVPYRSCKTVYSNEGRFITCEMEHIDDPTKRFTLCNIYAPNADKPDFFVNLFQSIVELSPEIMIIGDFNMVMNVNLDRKGSNYNPKQAKIILDDIMKEYDLCDIWRVRNQEERIYSWMRMHPQVVASRIDFALVSQGLSSAINNTMYLPGIQLDHLAFFVAMDQLNQERGRGYWKFNTRYLYQKEFIDEINDILQRKLEASIHLDKIERWQFLKNSLIKHSKEYAKNHVKERTLIISQLSEKLNDMQYAAAKTDFKDERKIRLMKDTMDELDSLLEEKAKETIFRTKSNWYEHGEKSSKFFLNMEKRRYNARLCNKILVEGDEIKDPEKIREIQFEYYKNLYTADEYVHFNLKNTSGISVRADVKQRDQTPFTVHT